MKNEKELQKKYFYSQILRQQASALMEEKQVIDARINEVNITKEAMKRMGEMKKGDLMWSPLGSGAFMIASNADTGKVLLNAGAGVLIKTERSHAIEVLDSRLKELQDADMHVTSELSKFINQLGSVEKEMQEMVELDEHKKGMEKQQPKTHGKVKGTGG